MIQISHLTKIFNKGTVNEKIAINDLSLNIQDGEFICMIGANGSGKSTLLNCLSGAILCEKGNIVMDDKDITLSLQHERASDIGYLFQDPMAGTAPHMTIEENLALAAKSGGWLSRISAKDRELFRKKLESLNMGLENKLKMEVGVLSGGMRQALTLIMNTIRRPKLLLLDEHTAALDPQSAEKILQLTEKTVEEGKLTCIMVTHNMQTAIDIGDRLIMMHEGRIILDLNKEEKEKMTVDTLRQLFKQNAAESLDNDRMLLQ
ncbi:MAG: ATP-binding cassette domain-containing protein [Erysipelotrichaceae bacterium]|nr:ATP-binding cassette domain-containing protein [Erysipelotrichaceae bacterium]MBQ2078955.1 ATP-binding cassette domain-containing protein [Erysipelotrichaceae bacterium]MBQ2584880.1 ATP-binding cassette domain-containing protein [Erysipelotrichaceae bacterium]MBQ3963632.1 ATP-binding cassette domain-containing protein [Erysipelotrichaceae bacterium]MBQ4019374.1 ATP-binding cassette domain-containing protein [Erysipelotrichaceae bacterium]